MRIGRHGIVTYDAEMSHEKETPCYKHYKATPTDVTLLRVRTNHAHFHIGVPTFYSLEKCTHMAEDP